MDARLGRCRILAIQYPYFEIDQVKFGNLWVMRQESFSQRLIERVCRAYSEARRVNFILAYFQSDDRLGLAGRTQPDVIFNHFKELPAFTKRVQRKQLK